MQKLLKMFWNEFIYGGHMTALGGPGIALATSKILGVPVEYPFLVIIYCLIEAIYLFDRIKDTKNDKISNDQKASFISNKWKYWPVVYIVILMFFCVLFGNTFFNLSLFIYVVLGMIYTEYTKPLTKKIIGFKNYIVILMWSSIPLLFYIYTDMKPDLTLMLLSIFMIFREFINTCFCDIKDIQSDKLSKVVTIPSTIGKKATILLLGYVNILSAIPLLIYGYFINIHSPMMFLLISLLYLQIYLHLAKKNSPDKNHFLFSQVPDFEPILYYLIMIPFYGL